MRFMFVKQRSFRRVVVLLVDHLNDWPGMGFQVIVSPLEAWQAYISFSGFHV